MAWHRLASLGMGLDACGRLVFYSVFVLGAALVSEWGVLVRKESRRFAVESGRARATDRGSGGRGQAEGYRLRAVLSRMYVP